ncbi:caspase family protein [Flammeovirga pacifica]|uniref:Peptidase C14 caspase domain-containing protein n=1 Tax=Flammeovirga pacifica TaxID=915059 RepID=A0A1S1YS46_FLAPC|nr:hypothetical protein [Flammeovirga pacifica]OHX63854.1 hypothetical protein NH26_19775 [Flammeovirga pacifica]
MHKITLLSVLFSLLFSIDLVGQQKTYYCPKNYYYINGDANEQFSVGVMKGYDSEKDNFALQIIKQDGSYSNSPIGQFSDITDIKLHPKLPLLAFSLLNINEDKPGNLIVFDLEKGEIKANYSGNFQSIFFMENDSLLLTQRRGIGTTNYIDVFNWKAYARVGTFKFKELNEYLLTRFENTLVYQKGGGFSGIENQLTVLDLDTFEEKSIALDLVSFKENGSIKYNKEGEIFIRKGDSFIEKKIKNIYPNGIKINQLANSYYIEDTKGNHFIYYLNTLSIGKPYDFIFYQEGEKRVQLVEDKIVFIEGEQVLSSRDAPFFLKGKNKNLIKTSVLEKGIWIYDLSGIHYEPYPVEGFFSPPLASNIKVPNTYQKLNDNIYWIKENLQKKKQTFVFKNVNTNELPISKSYQFSKDSINSFSKNGTHFTIDQDRDILYVHFKLDKVKQHDYIDGLTSIDLKADSIIQSFSGFNRQMEQLYFNRVQYDTKDSLLYISYQGDYGDPSNIYQLNINNPYAFEKKEQLPKEFNKAIQKNIFKDQYSDFTFTYKSKTYTPLTINQKLEDLNINFNEGISYLILPEEQLILIGFNTDNGWGELFIYDTKTSLEHPEFVQSFSIEGKISQLEKYKDQLLIALNKGEIQFVDFQALKEQVKLDKNQFASNDLSVYINQTIKNKVEEIVFLDGRKKLLGKDYYNFILWDLTTGRQLMFDKASDKGIFKVEGDTLIFGNQEENKQWLISKNKLISEKDEPTLHIQNKEDLKLFIQKEKLVKVNDNDTTLFDINKFTSTIQHQKYYFDKPEKIKNTILSGSISKDNAVLLFNNGVIGVYNPALSKTKYYIDINTQTKVTTPPTKSKNLNYDGAIVINEKRQSIFVSGSKGSLYEFDLTSGSLKAEIISPNNYYTISTITIDGDLLAIGDTHGKIKLFSLNSLQQINSFGHQVAQSLDVEKNVEPLNQQAFYINYSTTDYYEHKLVKVDFSRDIFSFDETRFGRYVDPTEKKSAYGLNSHSRFLTKSIAIDNHVIGIDYGEKRSVLTYNIENKRYDTLYHYPFNGEERIWDIFQSNDGKYFGITINKSQDIYNNKISDIYIFDAVTKEQLYHIEPKKLSFGHQIKSVTLTSNHQLFFTKDKKGAFGQNEYFQYDFVNQNGKDIPFEQVVDLYGNKMNTQGDILKLNSNAVASSDSKYIYIINYDLNILMVDVKTQKIIKSWPINDINSIYASSVNYNLFLIGDQKVLVGSDTKGAIKFWDIDENIGKLLATMYLSPTLDYIIYTPDLYYTSSKTIDNILSIKSGSDIYKFEQFDVLLNRPDIVFERLKFVNPMMIDRYKKLNKQRLSLLGIDTKQAIQEVPTIDVNDQDIPLSVEQESIDLNITAASKNIALNKLNIWVNNVPYFGIQGKEIQGTDYQINQKIPLSNGQNYIEVSCTDQYGRESIRWSRSINNQLKRKAKTVVIGIGVSRHQQADMNLTYADKDAIDFAQIFKDNAQDSSEVESYVITNEEVSVDKIESLKEILLKTTVDDHVYIFFAGHGTIYDKELYLSTYSIDFAQPSNGGLKYATLEDLIDGIPARNKAIFIDACQSGELLEDDFDLADGVTTTHSATNVRGLKLKNASKKKKTSDDPMLDDLLSNVPKENTIADIKNAFNEIRRGTGAFIFSSASGLEFAFEGQKWKNGVFTYALLSGLAELKADKNEDGVINVSELQEYLFKEVARLTDGKQNPTNRLENINNDFDFFSKKKNDQ